MGGKARLSPFVAYYSIIICRVDRDFFIRILRSNFEPTISQFEVDCSQRLYPTQTGKVQTHKLFADHDSRHPFHSVKSDSDNKHSSKYIQTIITDAIAITSRFRRCTQGIKSSRVVARVRQTYTAVKCFSPHRRCYRQQLSSSS